jgi:hypothetical protein
LAPSLPTLSRLGVGRGARVPVPWQQIVDPVRGMIGDAGQDISEPGLRIDVVHFTGRNQAINHRGALAAAVGARKQPRFAVMQIYP